MQSSVVSAAFPANTGKCATVASAAAAAQTGDVSKLQSSTDSANAYSRSSALMPRSYRAESAYSRVNSVSLTPDGKWAVTGSEIKQHVSGIFVI